jgi:hypothetical protein
MSNIQNAAAITFRDLSKVPYEDRLCYEYDTAEERQACYDGLDPSTVRNNNNNNKVKNNPSLPPSSEQQPLRQQQQQPSSSSSSNLIDLLEIVLFFAVPIIIGVSIKKIIRLRRRGGGRGWRWKGKYKDRERRGFPYYIKGEVLRNQNHRCAHCNKILNVVDWDHIDGNRSNNKESNCQALCPNCHAIKTRSGREE